MSVDLSGNEVQTSEKEELLTELAVERVSEESEPLLVENREGTAYFNPYQGRDIKEKHTQLDVMNTLSYQKLNKCQ
jgi:hypothetical protein